MSVKVDMNKMREWAKECRIDLIGAVRLSVFQSFHEKLAAISDREVPFFHGELTDRVDYRKEWEETQSILSFAVNYNHPVDRPEDNLLRGKISKASHGMDYHKVLKEEAERFMQKFIRFYPVQYRIYVDTGLLSDRALMYSAGLGFYGKNGFILHEKYGSYLFLGHILLNREFDFTYEPVKESLCGECSLCMKACPNGAIGEDFRICYMDCISYKTQIAENQDSKGYVYGCDICQDVCPFNRNLPPGHPAFFTDSEIAYPKLSYLENISKEDFSRDYGQSALAWRRRKTLRRNAQNLLNRMKCNENGG